MEKRRFVLKRIAAKDEDDSYIGFDLDIELPLNSNKDKIQFDEVCRQLKDSKILSVETDTSIIGIETLVFILNIIAKKEIEYFPYLIEQLNNISDEKIIELNDFIMESNMNLKEAIKYVKSELFALNSIPFEKPEEDIPYYCSIPYVRFINENKKDNLLVDFNDNCFGYELDETFYNKILNKNKDIPSIEFLMSDIDYLLNKLSMISNYTEVYSKINKILNDTIIQENLHVCNSIDHDLDNIKRSLSNGHLHNDLINLSMKLCFNGIYNLPLTKRARDSFLNKYEILTKDAIKDKCINDLNYDNTNNVINTLEKLDFTHNYFIILDDKITNLNSYHLINIVSDFQNIVGKCKKELYEILNEDDLRFNED